MNLEQSTKNYRPKPLFLKNDGKKGLGVYCQVSISKNEVIEICPTLKVPREQNEFIEKTNLTKYAYTRQDSGWSVVCGLGSFYNHSYKPNAKFVWDEEETYVSIIAINDIPPEEEIVFNYHGNPECQDPMWFDCV